jgi:hypothetical protein
LFNTFIAEEVGTKFTSKNYPAMKFADCSYVQKTALALNQVRFNVSVSSLSQNLDGYSYSGDDEGFGLITDPLVGTYMDHETGVLTISSSNLIADTLVPTANCRIVIQILLKKAGWKNKH